MLHLFKQNSKPTYFALFYFFFFAVAEMVTLIYGTQNGLIVYGLTIFILAIQVSITWQQSPGARFVLSLLLLPIGRFITLLLLAPDIPPLIWICVMGMILLTNGVAIVRILDLRWRHVGLTLRGYPLQVMGVLIGLTFGLLEYLLLQPAPIWGISASAGLIVALFFIFVAIGVVLELIFRGILQTTAVDALGRFGILYVACLFALFHFGFIFTERGVLSMLLSFRLG